MCASGTEGTALSRLVLGLVLWVLFEDVGTKGSLSGIKGSWGDAQEPFPVFVLLSPSLFCGPLILLLCSMLSFS